MSARASWSGQLAFVLAAAASAIGLGNLWRFPYLAAHYGGGVFIAMYLLLALTLGGALLITEIALGRKSRQSQLTVFGALGHSRWNWLGLAATLVPFLILPYYCVIGGWVVKYFCAYASAVLGGGNPLASPDVFFKAFIGAPWSPYVFFLIFTAGTMGVILLGVKRGIEQVNLLLMPLLLVMAFALALYVATRPGAGAGIRFYLVPDFANCPNLGKVILGAMGQMFYSLSLAMGIMITYGSYMRRDDSIPRSVVGVVFSDLAVAVLAGFMVVPAVVAFAAQSGAEGSRAAIEAGPGLMFVTLPKVFATLGVAGAWVGLAFFLLVLFAAFTSAISMTEACVAAVGDRFHCSRRLSVGAVTVTVLVLGAFSAFGYGRWSMLKPFGMPMLDFFDFFANSLMCPVVAAATCIFVGWVLGPRTVVDECSFGGKFRMEGLYSVTMRYLAPVLVIAILVSEVCRYFGWGGWSI